MPLLKYFFAFFAGFMLALAIALWIALSFTYLDRVHVLQAHHLGYTAVKGDNPHYSTQQFLQESSLQIAGIACSLFQAQQREAKWFGFQLDGTDQLVVESLRNIGAIQLAADIPQYCDHFPDTVLKELTTAAN